MNTITGQKTLLKVIFALICSAMVACGVLFGSGCTQSDSSKTNKVEVIPPDVVIDTDSRNGNFSGLLADGGASVATLDGYYIATADSIIFQSDDEIGTDSYTVAYEGSTAYLNLVAENKMIFVDDVDDFDGVLKGTRIVSATFDSETHKLTSEPDVLYSATDTDVISATSRIHDLYCSNVKAYFLRSDFDLASICTFPYNNPDDISSVDGFESDNRILEVVWECVKVLSRSTDDMGSYDGWACFQVDMSDSVSLTNKEFEGTLVTDSNVSSAAIYDGELYCCADGDGNLFKLSLQEDGKRLDFPQAHNVIHMAASDGLFVVITADGDIERVYLSDRTTSSLKEILLEANLYFVADSSHLSVCDRWVIVRDPLGGLYEVDLATDTAIAVVASM